MTTHTALSSNRLGNRDTKSEHAASGTKRKRPRAISIERHRQKVRVLEYRIRIMEQAITDTVTSWDTPHFVDAVRALKDLI